MLASSEFGGGVTQAVGQRHGFARSGVGQAEHHQVNVAHEGATGLGVLAAVVGQAAQGHCGQGEQALADAEAGGAGLAVDEHGCHA